MYLLAGEVGESDESLFLLADAVSHQQQPLAQEFRGERLGSVRIYRSFVHPSVGNMNLRRVSNRDAARAQPGSVPSTNQPSRPSISCRSERDFERGAGHL